MNISAPQLITKFLNELDAGEATIRAYKNALKQLENFIKLQKKKTLSKENIIAFREHMKAEGKRAATIQLYLVATRRFCVWLEEEGICSKNMAAGIKGAKTGSTFVKSCLTADQAKRLMGSIPRDTIVGKRDYALISLLLVTGIRTIEAARANVADIINQGKALLIQGKGHDAKDAYVKLPNIVVEALEGYLEARKAFDPSKSLFTSLSRRRKGKLTTRSISRIVKQRLRAIGLDDNLLSAHSLRHTAATLNLLAGGTLEETQQLLRHKNINTTLRYSHALERAKNQSEDRIASEIF